MNSDSALAPFSTPNGENSFGKSPSRAENGADANAHNANAHNATDEKRHWLAADNLLADSENGASGDADDTSTQESDAAFDVVVENGSLPAGSLIIGARALDVQTHEPEEVARAQVRALVKHTMMARPTSDSDLLMRAYSFAHDKHEGQARRTGEPYIEHPVAVAGILAELGMDDPTIAAGLLHDVLEDCGVSYDEMSRRFGAEVAQLVDGVTKLKHIDFSSKQEKQAENLRKLFLAMAGDVRVIIIKLCDRLHNMRTLDPFPEQRKREIAGETLHIFAPIAHRLGIWRIKWELEDRSFKYLEPEIYKQIYALVQRTRGERSQMVAEAIRVLTSRLKAEGIDAEVTGRPKHFYSIYQKMIKQGRKFNELHDLIALRVICRTVPDCYHALGIVHSLWMQIPEMFYDYIAKPKPNNYQSLHTKVMGPDGEPFEVQIRTREMHREAEFGIAAHWRYKETGENGKPFDSDNIGSKLKWLRLVLELQSDTKDDAQSFLDSLKLDLSADQLFVFTPRGDVIYLPQDSTPVDFAYRIHSDVGNSCNGAKVNGRMVPLDYKLHNGDICEVITSRRPEAGPKRDWLEFVVTPHAKNRIKSFLKKQNFDDNYREGQERLEKAAQSEKVKLGQLAQHEFLKKQAKSYGLRTVDDLVAAIGYGEYSAESIVRKIKAEEERIALEEEQKKSPVVGHGESLSGSANAILTRNIKTRTERDAGEETDGGLTIGPLGPGGGKAKLGGDILFSLAKCCAPIAGDKVRGYITRGRGVTIHRDDCPNLKHYEIREPNRLIDAQWTGEEGRSYRALIAIEARDRVGLLHDVTSLFSERRINICAVNTYPLKDSRARLNIAVIIQDVEQLNTVMQMLRSVEGVNEVHRV
jgi:GTP diphosphokinase / guanosine-3',5'-bis(diphosphate) 3'-diphosphatase